MDITPLINQDHQIIQSYGSGYFKISGKRYEHAVTVFIDGTIDWPVNGSVSDLTIDDFSSLIARADELDVVLLGTGDGLVRLAPDVQQSLKDKGLSIELMGTGAACRTYSVLMAEGRRVAAAMLPA